MFGNIRTKFAAAIATVLIGVQTLAQKFNTNVTGPAIKAAPVFATRRKPAFRTGIKGIASTNNTRYGAGLRAHFQTAASRRAVAAYAKAAA